MPLPVTRRLSGTALLCTVREDLAPFREELASVGKQVAILRFDVAQDDPPARRFRMEAARVSAEQKIKAFSRLGLGVDHRLLSPTVSAAEFAGLLTTLNDDPLTAAIIVQLPPPPRLAPLVQRLSLPRTSTGCWRSARSSEAARPQTELPAWHSRSPATTRPSPSWGHAASLDVES